MMVEEGRCGWGDNCHGQEKQNRPLGWKNTVLLDWPKSYL